MSSKTEKADVAKAGEDLQAYLEFLGDEFSAKDRGIGLKMLKAAWDPCHNHDFLGSTWNFLNLWRFKEGNWLF